MHLQTGALFLFTKKLALVGQRHFNLSTAVIEQQALATQARTEPRVHGTVNEIFFLIAQFFQKIFAFIYINMTGAARAYAAAVVVQLNVVRERHFQNALAGGNAFQR